MLGLFACVCGMIGGVLNPCMAFVQTQVSGKTRYFVLCWAEKAEKLAGFLRIMHFVPDCKVNLQQNPHNQKSAASIVVNMFTSGGIFTSGTLIFNSSSLKVCLRSVISIQLLGSCCGSGTKHSAMSV